MTRAPTRAPQLSDAVSELEQWDEGAAVVLTGAGGTFCAGLDLELARGELGTPEQGALMSQLMTETLYRFRQLPMLSVAAVDGYAVGGGAELTTAADWRVMAHDGATIRFVHARMGAAPGWGGGARLVQLVGRRQALKLLAHGTPLDGVSALRLGLCDGVGEAGEEAAEAATRLLIEPALEHAASVQSLRAIKTGIAAATEIAPSVRADETRAVGLVWGSEANRGAFGDRRAR